MMAYGLRCRKNRVEVFAPKYPVAAFSVVPETILGYFYPEFPKPITPIIGSRSATRVNQAERISPSGLLQRGAPVRISAFPASLVLRLW